MAEFIAINILDLDEFPQADNLTFEHGPAFVEIIDGDSSVQYEIDFSELYTAQELIEMAEEADFDINATCLDDADDAAFQVLASSGWERKRAYHAGETTFYHEVN